MLLTLAIVAHHFVAMGAVVIVPDPARVIDMLTLSPNMVALTVAGAAVAVLGMAIVASLGDRRAQGLLQDRNLLLDAALNNMIQGVNMFDAQARLVLFNERYMQMYRLSPDVVKPGCTIRGLVEHRIAQGTFFAADPEQYIAELTAALQTDRNPSRKVLELSDGRVIAVLNQPMAAGGWVVTHEDITERHRAQKELEKTRNFLHTVIENVPVPIIVKNAGDRRYVLINRPVEENFGLSRDQMIGKTAQEVFSASDAATVDEHDNRLLATREQEFFDVHPIETPGNGTRLVTSTRLPIIGEDGAPQYLVNVLQDVTERKRAEARIAHMAHYDALTDLPNRAAFSECLATTLARAAKEKDTLRAPVGRPRPLQGDQRRLRPYDRRQAPVRGLRPPRRRAREGAFLARLGGDEFALIASGGSQPASAHELAERLLASVADDFEIDGHRLRIGLSIGIAIYPADGTDASSLLGNADAALHRAKGGGRGTIRFFEAEMDQRLRERRALVQDLQTAVERGELVVYYQPQARMDGEITGFEALVRWQHPTRGLIAARHVHPGRRRERSHPADRRMGAARGLPRGGVVAEAAEHRASTSRRSSSGTAICPGSSIRCCSRPGSRPDASSSRSPRAC